MNTYGSLSSFIIGLTLRLLCGDEILGLKETISFGTYTVDGESGALPFRLFVMLITLVVHIIVSTVTHHIFVEEKIPLKLDFLKCYRLR